MPAKEGLQSIGTAMDSRFRGNDKRNKVNKKSLNLGRKRIASCKTTKIQKIAEEIPKNVTDKVNKLNL
jgi:hypothetical protein